MGVPAASGCLAEPERRHVAVEHLVMPRRDRVGLVPDADTGVAGAALTSAMTPSRASQAAAIGDMTIPQIAEGIAIDKEPGEARHTPT